MGEMETKDIENAAEDLKKMGYITSFTYLPNPHGHWQWSWRIESTKSRHRLHGKGNTVEKAFDKFSKRFFKIILKA